MNSQAYQLKKLIKNSKKDAVKITKTIAITSGKGGVGKSTISANLGYLFSNLGLKVVMFDADFGLANLDIMFNIRCKKNILDVLKSKASFEDISVNINKNLTLIPGNSGDEILKYSSSSSLNRLLKEFELLKNVDIIMVDTGAGLSEYVQGFLATIDNIIVIVTSDPSSITDAYATIKATSLHTKKIYLLLNNVKNKKEAKIIFDKINSVAKNNIKDIKLEYIGCMVNNDIVSNNVLQRTLFVKNNPNSTPSLELEKIADNILSALEHNVLADNKKTVNRFFRAILGRF